MPEKRYIGDGVYVMTDESGSFWLTTENGDGPPSNEICLEPKVWAALVNYATYARLKMARLPNET